MSDTNTTASGRRFLRRPAVSLLTGLPESTLFALMAQGKFPKSFRIGPRATAWDERDIIAWQDARLAERDKAAA